MANRKRDAEATRTAILDAAEQLFIEKGYGEASLSQIAKSANVTKSLIHHHFGSKDALWSEVKVRYYLDYTHTQENMLQSLPPSLDLLVMSMIKYFQYLQSKPDFARMRGIMLLEDDNICDEIFQPIVDQGLAALRMSQEKGEIRADIPPNHILISVLSMIENWFLSKDHVRRTHYRHIPDAEFDERAMDSSYLTSMLKIYLQGIVPPDFALELSLEALVERELGQH